MSIDRTGAGFSADVAVFILRAQPFHFGHRAVIEQALAQAKHVLLLLGSSHQPRSPRNPFTHEERAAMIRASFSADGQYVICGSEVSTLARAAPCRAVSRGFAYTANTQHCQHCPTSPSFFF